MHNFHAFHQTQQHERQLETRVLLKSYQHLNEQWQLSKKESYQLLNLNNLHQMAHWQQSADDFALTNTQSERLSFLLTIHKILDNVFADKKHIAQWIHNKHNQQNNHSLDCFQSSSPLEVFIKADKKTLQQLTSALLKLFQINHSSESQHRT